MVSLPGEEGTAMQIMSILRRNQVIAHPHGMFLPNHGQDVIPALTAPAFNIFIGYIGNKIRQAAFAAALTDNFRFMIHPDPHVTAPQAVEPLNMRSLSIRDQYNILTIFQIESTRCKKPECVASLRRPAGAFIFLSAESDIHIYRDPQ